MNEPESITSPANPRVKQAAALRDAEARRVTGLTLVDGRRELARAEAAGAEFVEVFVAIDAEALRTADAPPLRDWLARLAAGGTRIATLSNKAFDRIAFGNRNEGVVGVVRFGPRPLTDVAFDADRPLLIIEGVEKPGNLGAIIRTADAAGLGGVIVSNARTDVTNPAVIRASTSSMFSRMSAALIRITRMPTLSRLLSRRLASVSSCPSSSMAIAMPRLWQLKSTIALPTTAWRVNL